MNSLSGCGDTFHLLYEDEQNAGAGLPSHFQAIYGGDWRLPENDGQPYVYSNFATSHDGRCSYKLPGYMGGGPISGNDLRDVWLMGLLRARADCVMVGDGTLRAEPEHLWTAGFIYGKEKEAFAALRREERRERFPLHVFLSLEGNFSWDEEVFRHEEIPKVIATTKAGRERIDKTKPENLAVDLISEWTHSVAIGELLTILRSRYHLHTILCEGGPGAYGQCLREGVVTEEFLTECPTIVGNDAPESLRPGLIESAAFTPQNAPRTSLVSLRRCGDHLYKRYRYRYTN